MSLAPDTRVGRLLVGGRPQVLPGDRGLPYMSHETKVTSTQGAVIAVKPRGGGASKVIHRGVARQHVVTAPACAAAARSR